MTAMSTRNPPLAAGILAAPGRPTSRLVAEDEQRPADRALVHAGAAPPPSARRSGGGSRPGRRPGAPRGRARPPPGRRRVVAPGFSRKRCLPAASTAQACSAWSIERAASTTASTSARGEQLLVGAAADAELRARPPPPARPGDATATSSTPSRRQRVPGVDAPHAAQSGDSELSSRLTRPADYDSVAIACATVWGTRPRT